MFPGGKYSFGSESGTSRISVSEEDGALIIDRPEVGDSGHYTCSVVNQVGSAIARSHLLVYDESDFGVGPQTRGHSLQVYHNLVEDLDLNEARMASMEPGVKLRAASSAGPVSIKVNWEVVAPHKYLEGFRIWHKQSSEPASTFRSIAIMHSEATSFIINRLEEHTEYDVFVQPFYRSVLGCPAHLATRVLTDQDAPSSAPLILEAWFNTSGAWLAWAPLEPSSANGPITSYDVSHILHYLTYLVFVL